MNIRIIRTALAISILSRIVFALPISTPDFFETEKKRIVEESKAIERNIAALTLALQRESQKRNPLVTLISGNQSQEKDLFHRRILESSLQSLLKRKEILIEQEQNLIAERQIIDISNRHTQSKSKNIRTKIASCTTWPLLDTEPSKIIRDFGMITDPNTKITWQHSGWVLNVNQRPVVSCANGTVVFAGTIPGRGYVVLIDHGSKQLTTYGHLELEHLPNIKQGAWVKAGTKIGTSSNKFYFETRKDGIIVDPRLFFSKNLISARLTPQ